jgi:uncharacterized protein YhaN
MKNSMSIEQALQHLQDGKFSFGLVETIQNYLEFMSNQLADERNACHDKTSILEQNTGALELELLKCRAELDSSRREIGSLKIEVRDLKNNESRLMEVGEARINDCVRLLKQNVCDIFDKDSSASSLQKQNAA